MSCRDGGVAGCNRNLMEIRHDISGGIYAMDGCSLMGVYLEAADIVRPSSQRGHKFGSNLTAQRGIDDVEGNG